MASSPSDQLNFGPFTIDEVPETPKSDAMSETEVVTGDGLHKDNEVAGDQNAGVQNDGEEPVSSKDSGNQDVGDENKGEKEASNKDIGNEVVGEENGGEKEDSSKENDGMKEGSLKENDGEKEGSLKENSDEKEGFSKENGDEKEVLSKGNGGVPDDTFNTPNTDHRPREISPEIMGSSGTYSVIKTATPSTSISNATSLEDHSVQQAVKNRKHERDSPPSTPTRDKPESKKARVFLKAYAVCNKRFGQIEGRAVTLLKSCRMIKFNGTDTKVDTTYTAFTANSDPMHRMDVLRALILRCAAEVSKLAPTCFGNDMPEQMTALQHADIVLIGDTEDRLNAIDGLLVKCEDALTEIMSIIDF